MLAHVWGAPRRVLHEDSARRAARVRARVRDAIGSATAYLTPSEGATAGTAEHGVGVVTDVTTLPDAAATRARTSALVVEKAMGCSRKRATTATLSPTSTEETDRHTWYSETRAHAG